MRGFITAAQNGHRDLGGSRSLANIIYWREYIRCMGNHNGFIERFVDFVQQGLRLENPTVLSRIGVRLGQVPGNPPIPKTKP